jgi:hypothetical protein
LVFEQVVATVKVDDHVAEGDLFELANIIAEFVGGPSTIEDVHSNVLAYSTQDHHLDHARREAILKRRVPEEWLDRLTRDGVHRRMRLSDEVVRVEYPDQPHFHPRLATGLHVGDVYMGSIWISEADQCLDERAERALAEIAALVPQHLLRTRALGELPRRADEEVLREVLSGNVGEPRAVATLGVSATHFCTMLALRVDPDASDDHCHALDVTLRALQLVRLFYDKSRPHISATMIDSTVYVLVPARSCERVEAWHVAQDLVERVCARLSLPVRVAVGSTGRGLSHVTKSRGDVDGVLRVTSHSDPRVLHVDDVASRLVLMCLADLASSTEWLFEGRVAELAEHDRMNHTEYVATLRAFLEANGDIRQAAQTLIVHPNTLRYRLARLQTVAKLDLSDPDDRLVAQLQLRLTRDVRL